jgi:hypothetical protein
VKKRLTLCLLEPHSTLRTPAITSLPISPSCPAMPKALAHSAGGAFWGLVETSHHTCTKEKMRDRGSWDPRGDGTDCGERTAGLSSV